MNDELHIIDTNQSDGFGDCHGKMAAEGVSSSPHDETLSQPVLDEGYIMRREEAEQGRWYQLNYFWDVISPTLSASARQVWLAFFRHSDLMGKSCITRSRIAAMLSISKVSVSAGIKELKDAGLIDKLKNENGYQLSLCSKADLTPPVKQALHPPLRKLNTPSKADLTPPVKQALHITELPYRTDIQNIFTEEENATPPQNEVLEAWNKMATLSNLPQANLTKARTAQIRARMKEKLFRENWQEALQKIPASYFLTGKNDRGWRATLDWFLRPDSVVKTIEGKYDNAKPKYETDGGDGDINF